MIYWRDANMPLNGKEEPLYPSVNAEQWAVDRFMRAAQNGWLKILREIVEDEKYPIDQRDKNGQTALMMAAHFGQADAVEYLLDTGADVMLQDQEGFDAYRRALEAFGRSERLRAMELRELESYLDEIEGDESFDGYRPDEEEYLDLSTPHPAYEWIVDELRVRMKMARKASPDSLSDKTRPANI